VHVGAHFAREVLDAFQKRSRSLSRRGAILECLSVKEIVDGRDYERERTNVSIAYRVSAARVMLRVHAWDDRWVWIDARRASKSGWVWEFTTEGRIVAPGGARALVALAEETLDVSFLPSAEVPSAMSAIWAKRLASGPRPV
jgi:MoxR-like ATPase